VVKSNVVLTFDYPHKEDEWGEGVLIPAIALMMEAARTSETSVDIELRTPQYIPEDSELHTRRRENLKSHIFHSCLPNQILCVFLFPPIFCNVSCPL
jgi:hypothetical protein